LTATLYLAHLPIY